MAIWIKEQRVFLLRGKDGKPNLEVNEKYSSARISTSRSKGKDEDGYLYSNWYVKFFGESHKLVSEGSLSEGMPFVIDVGYISQEPYTNKDGERVYPKNPTLSIFKCSLVGDKNSKSQSVELPPEDDIPF